jgi:hypothetical protein
MGKMKETKVVNFLGYEADLDSPDNVVKIVFEIEGEVKRYDTSSLLQFKKNEDETLKLEIKNSKNPLAIRPMIYTKDTLFLETSMSIKQMAKEYLSATDSKEVLVVKTMFGDDYLGANTSKFSIASERLEKKDVQLSESNQKTELKAYETPSNIFEIYFSAMQQESLVLYAGKMAVEVRKELVKVKEVKEHHLFQKEDFKKEQELLVKMVLEAEISQVSKMRLEAESESANVRQMQTLIQKHSPEALEKLSKASDSQFPFREFSDTEEPFKMAVLDMQAGSGEGIFKGAEKAGIEVNLIGTELRDFNELTDGEALKENENYNVSVGIDTAMHLNDYESLFENKMMNTAVMNTVVYQNPPYTQNNELAKESVEVLAHDQNVFGLYPTSMEGFLKNNINGFVFTIPKQLSGYTDAKVPDNLIMVIGSKHDEQFAYETMMSRKISGLTLMNNIDTRAKNKSVTITDVDVEMATNSILKTIRLNRDTVYNLKGRMRDVIHYQSERNGASVLTSHLNGYIEHTKDKIENLGKIDELLTREKDKVMSVFNSSDTLKKEKLFPDYRDYNPERNYKKMTYSEVLLQRSLLVFYRDKYPEIFKIIKSLADDDGVELGLDESTHTNYRLSNPPKPEKKDIVATESLGLMKLAYYPTSFIVEDINDKTALLDIIKKVYLSKGIGQGDISTNTLEALNTIINDSHRLVIKNENKIGASLEINKEEVFVLVDEDGLDIAKLNISLTDFYDSMNKLEMFDINDYVEKAVLKDDKKKIILTNFLKHSENLIAMLEDRREDKNSEPLEVLAKKAIIKIKQIKNSESKTNKAKNEEQLAVYINYAKDNGIFDYFESFITLNEPKKLIEKLVIKNPIFTDTNKKEKEKGLIKIATLFSEMPISFYEGARAESEEMIREVFKELSKDSPLSKEALEDSEESFVVNIYEQLSEEYEIRKSVSEGAIKTAKMIVINLTLLKAQMNKGVDTVKLYDIFFENMMQNTFGLMPHQFKNPERFIEISDDKKVDILNWQMRSGKTLTFLMEMYLIMLYKGIDANLFIETKTMNDIVSQMMRHLPIMMSGVNFNMPKTTAKLTVLNPDNVYEFFTENSEVFANLPKILSDNFVNKGKGQLEELERFGFEFEELMEKVEEKGMTLEGMREQYKDAIFAPLLANACK